MQRWSTVAAGAALALTSTAAIADDAAAVDSAALAQQVQQLQARLAQQESEIAQLRQGEDEAWLSERRREEVKGLVREVLADADTRASLLQEGLQAGYDKGFFIASADGNFSLRVGIEGQIRYIYNNVDSDGAANDDEDEFGFQMRQARLDFRGHALNPNLTYRIRLAGDRATGDVDLQILTLGYEFADGWQITAGRFKPQFLREENVSGFQQLAAERSYLADYFSVDYVEGAELTYDADRFRAAASLHDGSYSRNTEFNSDRTDAAVSGRVEFLAAGDSFRQFNDFTSWSNDEFALLLGAAAGYELGESGVDGVPDLFKYSVDASAEFGGFNLFGALYGQSFAGDDDDAGLPSDLADANQLGLVVQGGAFVVPDKVELFGRYEWIDFDGVYYRNSGGSTQGATGDISDDELSIITLGGNYYLDKHAAKFTLDVLYALDPVPASNTAGGLLASDEDGQVAVRGQFQFRF